jgi:hypothetical protein
MNLGSVGRDKRLFGGEVKKDKKSYFCFVRKYDAAHLSKHPLQKVSAMALLVKAEVDAEDGRVQHSFQLGVQYRGQNIELKDLLPGFVVAEQGGVVRIAELQSMGYVYLRP